MVQTTETTEPDGAELDWRRPHPITIVVEIGRAIRSVVIAVAVVSGGLFDRSSLLELALIIAPLVGALARWYTTRYALGNESIHHHHGLIWRSKQVLPRSNVQNVSTKAGVLARMASVVELQISDASATGDISLRYLTQTEADRLTTLLRSSFGTVSDDGATDGSATDGSATDGTWVGAAGERPSVDDVDSRPWPSTTPPPVTDASTATDPGHPIGLEGTALGAASAPSGPAVEIDNVIVSTTIRELIRAELATLAVAGLLLMACVLAVLGPLAIIFEPIDLPDDLGRLPWLIAGVVVVGPATVAALGVGAQLLVVGGYRLMAEPDRLRIQVGLLTEARITARRERIQQIRVERQILHRRLGLERVAFETADLEAVGSAGTRFLQPAGPTGSWRALAEEVFGEVQLEESDLEPVSSLTARRMFVRFGVASIPMLGLGLLNPLLPIPVVAIWLLIGWAYSRSRFERLGWAVSPDQYLVRNGVLHGRLTLVRLDKVQSLRLHSTFFQRRLGLATVKISTAGRGFGGLVSLPDVPNAQAEELLAQLSRRAGLTPIAETL